MAGQKKGEAERVFDAVVPGILTALALVALVGAVLRMSAPGEGILKRLDETTLLYLGVAGALLLLRHVKSLAFGNI